MVIRLFIACSLMALCVTIHAGGLTYALRRLRRSPMPAPRFWSSTRLFVAIAVWIVLLHLAEVSAWAAAYTWNGAMPDLETALYFSAVTYTTTGYGDVVLPQGWRLDGGVEALTGILMCGWSTGFFFAIVNRLYEPNTRSAAL
ncbi:MAG TPA: potassium channel family protein [Vicinamibacterales bacterium]|nr:potassium channel family protein [Vicinamibacterales bacterium]